ncbi:unnamed protein product, partial [Brassica oleracea]
RHVDILTSLSKAPSVHYLSNRSLSLRKKTDERPAETSTDLTETTTEAPEKKVRKGYTISKSRQNQEPCLFLKVQKNGTFAHVPPPTPKRKAAHPYPQKASKNGLFYYKIS